jgi:signal transduction histidine kinase
MTKHHMVPGDDTVVRADSARPGSAAAGFRERRTDIARSRTAADCEERLHAVRSSLAGLSSALHVLGDKRAAIPQASRRRVEKLLISEVERLRRLVAPPLEEELPVVLEELDLDTIVGDVALLRRLCGQEISWQPSGCRIRGRQDDLVEALNILLVNAWRHAEAQPTRIEAVSEAGLVLVTVSDDGPGVPAALRNSVFERGVRRSDSGGQGIGLAMARQLVESLGGRLTLSQAGSGGAAFCITLAAVWQKGVA